MYKLIVLAICLLATSVLSCENGYSGDKCRGHQKTVIDTKACTRTCVNIYSLKSCKRFCPKFKEPECNEKQRTIRNFCSCTRYCVDVLGEGEKCDQSKKTICEKVCLASMVFARNDNVEGVLTDCRIDCSSCWILFCGFYGNFC